MCLIWRSPSQVFYSVTSHWENIRSYPSLQLCFPDENLWHVSYQDIVPVWLTVNIINYIQRALLYMAASFCSSLSIVETAKALVANQFDETGAVWCQRLFMPPTKTLLFLACQCVKEVPNDYTYCCHAFLALSTITKLVAVLWIWLFLLPPSMKAYLEYWNFQTET